MSQRVFAAHPESFDREATSFSAESIAIRGRGRPRHTSRLKNLMFLFLAVLREIFDESAYARFLARNRLSASRTAYAEFLREHEVAKVRRPRCC
jgi:hypothetical protein